MDDVAQCCGFLDSILQDNYVRELIQLRLLKLVILTALSKLFLENEGVVQLSDLFYHYSFKLCDCLYDDDINYTFRCITHNAFPWMDHFCSENLFPSIASVSVIDDGDNNFDHSVFGTSKL